MNRISVISLTSVIVALSIPARVEAGAGLDQRLRAVQEQRRAQQMAVQQQQRSIVAQRQLQQRQAQVMQQQMLQQRQAQANVAQQRVIAQQLQRQAAGRQQLAYQQAQQQQQQLYQQQLRSRSNQIPPISAPNYNSTPPAPSNYPLMEMHVEEVVDMKTIWEDFEISSEAWPLIIDRDAKEVIVARFMEDFRANGVRFRQSTRHYVELIDSMSFENPDILKNSFDKVLQMVAIIEYDFDNGVNPDDLARRILGEQAYQQNKKRLNR